MQVAYIYSDDADRYTEALRGIGLNLRVEGVRSEVDDGLTLVAPTPASVKRVSTLPVPFAPPPAQTCTDPRKVARSRTLELLELPAPAGRWSRRQPPPWPVGYRPESSRSIERSSFDVCPLCDMPFKPRKGQLEHLTTNRVAARTICEHCFEEIGIAGRPRGADMAFDDVISTLRQYYEITGQLPRSSGPDGAFIDNYPRSASYDELVEFLRLLWDWPGTATVASLFGGWEHALWAAGLLGREPEVGTRGVRSIAADGHECFSYGERIIDDWLHSQGIAHEREPRYGDTNYRGDFLVGDVVVEYLGLRGDPVYDAKTASKRAVAARQRIRVVEVAPAELGDWPRLAERLGLRVKRWHPKGIAVPRPGSVGAPAVVAGLQEARGVPGWFTDPFEVAHERYFDGSGWTHHTLTADGTWRAHTPWGDRCRAEASAWVAAQKRIREAPPAANGKFGDSPEGLSFWLAAIDEYENSERALRFDSAFTPAYRGAILYAEASGPALMAIIDRCARFDRARFRTKTDRVLSIFERDGCRPDFESVGLVVPAPQRA